MYWFSFTAQIKAVIEPKCIPLAILEEIYRKGKYADSLRGTDDEKRISMEWYTLTELMTNYLKWNDRGTLLVKGVNEKGRGKKYGVF